MVSGGQSIVKRLGEILPMVDLSQSLDCTEIVGLTIDSRAVKPGYIFVAVRGVHTHGREFIPQAVASGAVIILVDSDEEFIDTNVPVVAVDHLEKKLSQIANYFYGHPSEVIPVIGITGTNGKTTCTQLLAQCLSFLGEPCGVMGTLGYGLLKPDPLAGVHSEKAEEVETFNTTGMTTPDAIRTQGICAELLEQNAHYIAMEVSSHGLIQHRASAVDINTAVFTNLSHDHLDYHGTMDAYGEAKSQLFCMPSVSVAVINQDDAYAQLMIDKVSENVQLITYSLNSRKSVSDNAKAHFLLTDIRVSDRGMQALLVFGDNEITIDTALAGEFNLSNLLAVIAVLHAHNFEMSEIVKAISSIKPVPGRMELIPNCLGLRVVVDYAHTPDALKNALVALAPYVEGKLWCVFGCGGDRDREKRPKMAAIAESIADKVVVTSDNPRSESPVQIFSDIEKGFSITNTEHEFIADRADAIKYAISEANAGDVVLIAGKGHEDYQVIGSQTIHFSDQHHARFSLRRREAEAD
jgi:UDP-N-acetylmuramoyl-L-alanyl-D-glutamate--2,6-diaminopimelate ligase